MLLWRKEKGDISLKNIQLNLSMPDMVVATESELKMMLASRLYEIGQLSLGQAADVAGFTKRAFIEMLGKYNVSLFSQTVQELREDASNA
jgi:predicted HTH domain antitoxin